MPHHDQKEDGRPFEGLGAREGGIIRIIDGDLTQQVVDAIVNAANSTLVGGGGVDGAIHRRAGPQLLAECRTLGGCPVGEAKMTGGYNLPARWVIHTVGPRWRGGTHREDEQLARCYQSCLQLAVDRGIRTIAFPAISTGAYGFPVPRAARIALRETRRFLAEHPHAFDQVIFVCFGQADYERYREAAAELEGVQP